MSDWETHQIFMKAEIASVSQWRATSLRGSFREPVDYKGVERSNHFFLGVSSFSSCGKTFFMSLFGVKKTLTQILGAVGRYFSQSK